ncbi:MAG: DUF1016 N-terminal domain-containing protein [Methylobacter sp.]
MSDFQPADYQVWLKSLKTQIQAARQRAVLAVNQELLKLYWQIGDGILQRQQQQGWGSKVIDRLAQDLRLAFPEMKGFSARNLKYMRRFAEIWPDAEFVQQTAAQLPWFHICTIMDKLQTEHERQWYMCKAVEYGWSRNVLVHQIESRLLERQGQAATNFAHTLPAAQSELAQLIGCADARRRTCALKGINRYGLQKPQQNHCQICVARQQQTHWRCRIPDCSGFAGRSRRPVVQY